MIDKQFDTLFDTASSGQPWMVCPKVFSDNRGTFSEVLVGSSLESIKQINRSTSCQWTVRGFHAQRAPMCQAKLVEALTIPIYDIIVDARPDSKTFGTIAAYLLDPKTQNKLYVPHGFLHAFAVPPHEDTGAIACFMYYCDNTYCKETEFGIRPMDIVPKLAESLSSIEDNEEDPLCNLAKMLKTPEKLVLSKKDLEGKDYISFMEEVQREHQETRKLWYMP